MDLFEVVGVVGGIILLVSGGLCLWKPERAAGIDRRYLPKVATRGHSATPIQEKLLFRLTGAGLIILGVVLIKGMF
ncbi:MAG: hypothetical protein V2A65_08170 [Candidatus Omnitrophota bacterium]